MCNISKSLKLRLLRDSNGRCYYCSDLFDEENYRKRKTTDHKTPIVKGGNNSFENLCLACFSCNEMKGTKTEKQFQKYLEPLRLGVCKLEELSEYNLFLKLLTKYKKNECMVNSR
jgi:5-methylcytosine-specific restriction endonuclease McrA